MEEVLFKSEQKSERAEIADYLRQVAEKLESGSGMKLESGSEDVTVEVPSNPTFEVKVERETSDTEEEMSVEFEIEWKVGEEESGKGGELSIG